MRVQHFPVLFPLLGREQEAGNLPPCLADQPIVVVACDGGEVAIQAGEPELVILLPVPVGGQLGERPEPFLVVPQALFGLLALADVHHADLHRTLPPHLHGDPLRLHIHHTPIDADVAQLCHRRNHAFCQQGVRALPSLVAVIGMDEIDGQASQQLGRVLRSHDLEGHRIGVGQHTILMYHDTHRRGLDQCPVPVFILDHHPLQAVLLRHVTEHQHHAHDAAVGVPDWCGAVGDLVLATFP